MREVVRRNPAASIRHCDADDIAGDRHVYVDLGRALGILGGIVEEIEKNVLEQNRISFEGRQRGRNTQREPDPRKHFRGPIHRGAYRIAGIEPIAEEARWIGLEPRHVEKIADEMREVLRFLFYGRQQIGARCLVELRSQLAKARYGTDDGGERRLEVVREGGEECRA